MEEDVEQIEHIPKFLSVESFIAARFKELTALTDTIGKYSAS